MMKFKKSKPLFPSISEILIRLSSDNAMEVLIAIRDCVVNAIIDDRIVDRLKHLKQSPLIEWNSAKISSAACAALHLLGVEQYSGSDQQTQEYIETRFFTATN